MDLPTINAEERTVFKKEHMRKLRRAGKIPAVAYGPKLKQPIHLTLERSEVQKILQSISPEDEVRIKFRSKNLTALVKDIQLDVLTGEPLHLDFYVI